MFILRAFAKQKQQSPKNASNHLDSDVSRQNSFSDSIFHLFIDILGVYFFGDSW
jgi:hypothetical protein